jgi:hypothetical protein
MDRDLADLKLVTPAAADVYGCRRIGSRPTSIMARAMKGAAVELVPARRPHVVGRICTA